MSVPVSSQRVASGDVMLSVYRRGDARRPTVLLVHGYPDNATTWQPVADLLAADFHVVTYDVRGAGASDRPGARAGYRLEKLADDLAAVIATVSPGVPVHLVAHDWGSIQSWEAVCRDSLQARIASFTSISGPGLDHAGTWLRRRLLSASPRAWREGLGQVLRSWYVVFFHLPFLPALAWRLGLAGLWPRLMRRVEGAAVPAAARPAAQRRADGLAGLDLYRANFLPRLWRPQRRTTRVPVQLLVPVNEHYVSPHIHDDLPDAVPRLWRRELAGGHWPQLSRPQAVASCVAEFVRFAESGDEPLSLRRVRVAGGAGRDHGRLVIVTGAGSGIGRETLLDFAQRGACVVAVDISLMAAERTAMLARLLGAEAHAFRVDVGSAAAMAAFAAECEHLLGAPDVVVNNAGIGMAGAFLQTEAADWERLLGVNLMGVIHGSRLFGRQMVAAGKAGHIVNVASAAAFSPNRAMSAYATSKAAVFMLNDCLRAELAAQGIGVVTVCPGFVDTAISTSIQFLGVSEREQARKRSASQRLYQLRNLSPKTVAAAILAAVDSDRAIVLVGIEAWSMRLLQCLAPWLTRAMARIDPTP